MDMIYYSKTTQSKISKGENVHGVKSVGNPA
jgi:hypothetical protein